LTDSLALVDFYNAVKMDNFAAAAKWNLTAPLPATGTSTNWPGVRVNAQGRVDSLYFAASVIPNTVTDARLPESIGNLKELRGLVMNGSASSGKLNGAFPASFWILYKMRNISLTTNNLSGTIPAGVGNLTELTNFALTSNANITGPVPPEIGNLTKLTAINFSNTGVTSLPIEFRNCVSMINFFFYGTQIIGLPEIFDNMPNLGSIMVNDCPNLTGPLPATIGSINVNKNVTITMQNCNFTGGIPAAWGNFSATGGSMRITGNKLSGEIPAALKANPIWPTWWNAGSPAATGANICAQQAGFGFTNCSL